jgi:hypothetical protein
MILFVVPIGVALADHRPTPPPPYRHLSTWRLLGGEFIDGLQSLWRWARQLLLTAGQHRADTSNMKHQNDAAHELEATVRPWATDPQCSPAGRIDLLSELGSIGLTLERQRVRPNYSSSPSRAQGW